MKLLQRFLVFLLTIVVAASFTACKKEAGESTPAPTSQAPATTAPVTTAPPSESEAEESKLTEKLEIPVDALTTYYSIGENNGWQNAIYLLGDSNTGKQYVALTVTPAAEKIDGSVNFTDSSREVAGFDDLSIMVRMNADGYFDAINGDSFEKLADVAYAAGSGYLVEILADMNAKTYNVYVTEPEGERFLIADGFAFRTAAADTDDLGQAFLVSAGGNDLFTVDYFNRQMLLEKDREYWSKGENFGWQQNGIYLGDKYTGKVEIEFDMSSNIAPIGGSVSFADSDKTVFGFGDLSMLVRMNFTFFDARNGELWEKVGDAPVTKDTVYHINLLVDLDNKTHTYWVTPPGGEKTLVAENYAFRTTANDADDIGQVFVISENANDQIMVTNLVVTQK